MSTIVMALYKIISFLKYFGIPLLPSVLNKILIRSVFGCQLGIGIKFGKNVKLGYGGLGVVIHERAEIGNNVTIGTCVTIGGTSKKYEVPTIGDNTIISTGAKIIGPIKIGMNCIIGANAVVVKNVPNNCVVVGVPAEVIKKNINISDYK